MAGEKPNASDQLKNLIKNLRKHHFWLVGVVSLVVALVVWSTATGNLQSAFALDARKIDGAFGGVRGLINGQLRNQDMIGRITDEQTKINTQATDTWNELYERQKPLFQWPEELKDVANLPPGTEVPRPLRIDFQQTIVEREWKNLFFRAKPLLTADEKPPASETDYKGIVEWPFSMRDALLQRYIAPQEPSDVRVRSAMEDIWIYQNFVDIIRDMNEGAKDQADATIKRIRSLEIAQWAIAAAHAYQGANLPELATKGGAGRGFSVPVKNPGAHFTDSQIRNGRYVDGDNRPIGDGAKPPFAEFRQMFVVMRFVMVQSEIPRLLARCANARFPIVARQVLVKFQDVDSTPVGQDEFDQGAFTDFPIGPTDICVEIRGLIFLYDQPDAADTPPEKRRLGTGTAAQPAHRKLGIPPLTAAGP